MGSKSIPYKEQLQTVSNTEETGKGLSLSNMEKVHLCKILDTAAKL